MSSWLPQLVVAVVSLATGILATMRTRRHRTIAHAASGNTSTGTGAHTFHPPLASDAPRPALNGYAEVLRQTVERLEWYRGEYERERIRAEVAEAQLSDCEKRHIAASEREAEREKERRRATQSTSSRPRTRAKTLPKTRQE